MSKEKVVVGLSGGVDSSVAALLLKEQGYEVVGVTMRNWQDDSQAEDARRVAQVLDIPYYVMEFQQDFRRSVVDYFIREYMRGYTPNPCNACNRYVKWEALLRKAQEMGADYIATGHYARIEQLANGRYSICNSCTAAKDQTYALYNLTQEQLAHTLMPVGAYEKARIREMAEEAGLPVAHKSDSQDICFIPDHDYAGFIKRETGVEFVPGNFVDVDGHVLGQHRGIIHYTIGQRKGLGITAETPLFVKELRPETNEVVICKSEELFTNTCIVGGMNYMAWETLHASAPVIGKVRYAHSGAPCKLTLLTDGRVECTFEEPQRAMTPGQAAVFYEDGHIVCGGTIER